MMRCRLRITQFNFQVVYKKSILNTQDDSLSRLSTLGETSVPMEEYFPCFTIAEGDPEPQWGYIEKELLRWKQCIPHLITDIQDSVKEEDRDKRDFDKRIVAPTANIERDASVFLRKKFWSEKDKKHKLDAIAGGHTR